MSDRYNDVQWQFDETDRVVRITLDRPSALNAFSPRLRSELTDALRRVGTVDDDPDYPRIDAVVITGAGDRAFSVGADVNTDIPNGTSGRKQIRSEYALPRELPMPVVAKIDGYCLGGGLELALACDFRLATEDSEFGFPESRLGVLPANGGLHLLATYAGPSRAKELAMSGERINCDEAVEEGFVDHIRDGKELDGFVDEFLDRITSGAPLAVRGAKDIVDVGIGTNTETAIAYEHRTSRSLRETRDHEEGIAAFTEDREPNWEGR